MTHLLGVVPVGSAFAHALEAAGAEDEGKEDGQHDAHDHHEGEDGRDDAVKHARDVGVGAEEEPAAVARCAVGVGGAGQVGVGIGGTLAHVPELLCPGHDALESSHLGSLRLCRRHSQEGQHSQPDK